MTYANIREVINSATYKKSSDAEKAEAIQNLLSVATAAGKRATNLDDGEVPAWAAKSPGSVADNAVYRAKLGTAKDMLPDDAQERNGDVMQVIIKTVLNKRGGNDRLALNVMAQKLTESTQGKVETAYGNGYSLQQIANFYQAKNAKTEDGKNQYKKADLRAWALQNGYASAQFDQLWGIFG